MFENTLRNRLLVEALKLLKADDQLLNGINDQMLRSYSIQDLREAEAIAKTNNWPPSSALRQEIVRREKEAVSATRRKGPNTGMEI
jgi:hypothetical protein